MKRLTFVLAPVAALAAVAVTGGAVAAPAIKDPAKLVLRKADVPGATGGPTRAGTAAMVAGLRARGVRARAAAYAYLVPTGGITDLNVTGMVVACSDARAAAKAYAQLVREIKRERGATAIRLPAYGQQQHAQLTGKGTAGQVVVRRNSVVWSLSVDDVFSEQAEIVAALKRYAAKQQRRVGRG